MMSERKIPQEQIESLLNRIKPKPSPRFHQHMQDQPWNQSKPSIYGTITRRLAIAIIWAIVLVLFISLLTPTLNVVAQRWLQFFLPAHSNQATVQVPQREIDLDFSLSLPEAENQAGFKAIQPDWLPKGYQFEGAAYQFERQAIVLKFVTQDGGHQLRILQRTQGPDFQRIGGGAQVEIVKIGEISGEYVSGAWTIPEVKSSRDEITNGGSPTLEIKWNPEAGIQFLRWENDRMLFEIFYVGNSTEDVDLTKTDLITIAKSMH